MLRLCPHCNHARRADEEAPDWQCPACGKAYAKAAAAAAPAVAVRRSAADAGGRSGKGRWFLLALLLAAVAVFGRPWLARDGGASAAVEQAAGQPAVVMYATSWCGYCRATRDFFAANGIRYVEHDIERDSAAAAEHQRLGGHGVPLVRIGDEQINGYNEAAMRELLGPWLQRR